MNDADLRKLTETIISKGAGTYGTPNWYEANDLSDDWCIDPDDAVYIAAANPQALIELLDELKMCRQIIKHGAQSGDELAYVFDIEPEQKS